MGSFPLLPADRIPQYFVGCATKEGWRKKQNSSDILIKSLLAKKFNLMFEVKKKVMLSTKERTYRREHHNQVKSFSYEAIVYWKCC